MNIIPDPIIIPVNTTWVSDGLEEEFPTWSSQQPVLISSQTGTGKNRFVMEYLIPYARKTGQRVYLFTNRVALSLQQKRELLHMDEYPNIFSNDELEKMTDFNHVSIINYQSALQYLHQFGYENPIGAIYPDSHGFAIFDEAHFFLSDSLFNAQTQQILNRLIWTFSLYVRVYLTATPRDILQVINKCEMTNLESEHITPFDMRNGNRMHRKRALYVYEFPRNYTDYNVAFFSSFEQLYGKLGKASSDNKWLCYVNDTQQQTQIAKDLKDKYSISSVCFDSTKKGNSKLWNTLVDGQLPENILLTTIVLDNGVNITDPGLHNIVIDWSDDISFLQMVGRKRRTDGEKINLYVRSPQQDQVVRRFKDVGNLLDFIQQYHLNPQNFLRANWQGFDQERRNLFDIDSRQHPVLNQFAWLELCKFHDFYKKLLFDMQNAPDERSASEVYPKMVLGWLGLQQDVHWVAGINIENAISEIRALLERYIEKGIPPEEHDKFFDQFARLADIILNGYSKIRKDSRIAPSIMRDFLEKQREQLGCYYSIGGRGTWKIRKED